jgi:urease accessory protein
MGMGMGTGMGTMTDQALLPLLRLVSPALPVGGFSYSRGLEYAVGAGWVTDEASALSWIAGVLEHGVGRLDVPGLARLHAAWSAGDGCAVARYSALLYASRESRELQLEEQQMGRALARLLRDLGIVEARALVDDERVCFASAFALAASRWGVAADDAMHGYLYNAAESQVSAAIRLVPLGQTAGQRMLSRLIPLIARVVASARELDDDELGGQTPGLASASARHETQYTRLFRS